MKLTIIIVIIDLKMYIPHHELLDYTVKCGGVVESPQPCVQCESVTPCGETGHFSANQKDKSLMSLSLYFNPSILKYNNFTVRTQHVLLWSINLPRYYPEYHTPWTKINPYIICNFSGHLLASICQDDYNAWFLKAFSLHHSPSVKNH